MVGDFWLVAIGCGWLVGWLVIFARLVRVMNKNDPEEQGYNDSAWWVGLGRILGRWTHVELAPQPSHKSSFSADKLPPLALRSCSQFSVPAMVLVSIYINPTIARTLPVMPGIRPNINHLG